MGLFGELKCKPTNGAQIAESSSLSRSTIKGLINMIESLFLYILFGSNIVWAVIFARTYYKMNKYKNAYNNHYKVLSHKYLVKLVYMLKDKLKYVAYECLDDNVFYINLQKIFSPLDRIDNIINMTQSEDTCEAEINLIKERFSDLSDLIDYENEYSESNEMNEKG